MAKLIERGSTLIMKIRVTSYAMAINCSAAISAACHPPPGDTKAAFKPVMWGEVDMPVAGGGQCEQYRHCCFTSKEAKPLEPDELYA